MNRHNVGVGNRPEQRCSFASYYQLVFKSEPQFVSRFVLVVDDEPLVLDVTASMLEDLGCEVITAANGN